MASPTLLNRNGKWPPFTMGGASFGGPWDFVYQAVPTALTDVSTVTSHIVGLVVYNPTGGALTFTIQTKDASPLALPLSGSIAAAGFSIVDIPFGLLCNGGFSVQGSGAGLLYSAVFTH